MVGSDATNARSVAGPSARRIQRSPKRPSDPSERIGAMRTPGLPFESRRRSARYAVTAFKSRAVEAAPFGASMKRSSAEAIAQHLHNMKLNNHQTHIRARPLLARS